MPFSTHPFFSSSAAKYRFFMPAREIAIAHIAHGSSVVNIEKPYNLVVLSLFEASLKTNISA